MKKRAIYSIPFAGLALTSIGCPGEEPEADKIIDTFTINTARDLDFPYVVAAVDVNGDGTLLCDVTIDATDITIADDLTGNTTVSITYSGCLLNGVADPASDGEKQAYAYEAAVTVVTLNAAYTIALTDAAGALAFTLDCTLAGATVSCTDDVGAAWVFTAQ